MSLSALAIGGNLEVNGLVSQLMAIERQPLAVSQQREAKVQAQLSAYGRLQSQIALFGDAAASLGKPGKLSVYSAAIADAEVASVSAGQVAEAGSYLLEVKRIAKADRLATSAFASPGSPVGAGLLTISLGTYGGAGKKFTPRADMAALTVNIDSGNNTLAGVRDAINAAHNGASGVSATIDTDGGGVRLVISSTGTGAGNAIRIEAPGLAAFAFDPAAESTQAVSQLQTAQDAVISIDNRSIVSASNQITGTVDGMTLNLVTAKPGQQTTVTVTRNKEPAMQALRDFVASYNTLSTLARGYTKYDVATKIKGALQGEATAVSVINELHTTISGAIPAPAGEFSNLGEIGITLQADGSLKFDESKLAAAMASESGPEKLARLFAASPSNPDTFVTRIASFVDRTQGTSGLISSTTEGLSTTIKRLDREQENINMRLAGVEAYLRQQFNALDSTRGSHDALAAYATNQNTIWSNAGK